MSWKSLLALAPSTQQGRWLLAQVLQMGPQQLLPDQPPSAEQQAHYHRLLARLSAGEPLAYVLGSWPFWDVELRTTAAALAPRPETEAMLVWACQQLSAHQLSGTWLDVGCGSGALALALKHHYPAITMAAMDCSAPALALSQHNANALKLELLLWRGHGLRACAAASCDGIVSNPPYLAADDPHLAELHAEPRQALVAGPSGLEMFEELIAQAQHCLKPSGVLLLEHGYDQQAQVLALLAQHNFRHCRCFTDLGGQARAVLAEKRSD